MEVIYDPAKVIAFVTFSAVVSGTPGPSNALLTAVGARAGVRRGLIRPAIGFDSRVRNSYSGGETESCRASNAAVRVRLPAGALVDPFVIEKR